MNEVTVQHLTPTTRALLRWWFRPTKNTHGNSFHPLPRQTILATISAHEASDRQGRRPAPLTHRVVLGKGGHQLQTIFALVVWQLANHFDALAAGVHDPRFTHQFVLIAPHAHVRDRLLDAFCGPLVAGAHGGRDFGQSDVVRLTSLLIPIGHRAKMLDFLRVKAGSGTALRRSWSEGAIAITDGRLEAFECLTRLPHAMVFDDETRAPYIDRYEDHDIGMAWRRQMRRFALGRNGRGAQVLFTGCATASSAEPQVSARL